MATKGEQFAGLTVALVTPFRDGALDEPALRRLVAACRLVRGRSGLAWPQRQADARDAVSGYCNRTVTVAVSGNYSYFFYKLLGWMGKAVPNAVNIARSTTMRWEPQAGCGFA